MEETVIGWVEIVVDWKGWKRRRLEGLEGSIGRDGDRKGWKRRRLEGLKGTSIGRVGFGLRLEGSPVGRVRRIGRDVVDGRIVYGR